MNFRIADTFTSSLGKLTAQEQKAAKTTAFDLQMDSSSPGLSFHKLDRAKDTNFWSVRVNADIRIIVHRTDTSILLAYVGHHDDAYRWAERRRIERHPTTGAMQMVEVRERVKEETTRPPAPTVQEAPNRKPPKLFDNLRKLELMSFGVPEEWVEDIRNADEDTLFDVIRHLPQEAQEALLKLAVGEAPEKPTPAPADADPFQHPDAQRRFRLVASSDELQQALDYPWDKWMVFLHPDQRELVERSFNGPARVSGSAGTGKTIVALHRAVHLARKYPQSKVLLTSFSKALANGLKNRLNMLAGADETLANRITVTPMASLAYDLYTKRFGQPQLASRSIVENLLAAAAKTVEGHNFSMRFLTSEWNDVVDAWQLKSWDEYRDVTRIGRKTRIGEKQRAVAWKIFESLKQALAARNLVTWADVFDRLAESLVTSGEKPFDMAVVDECQDIGVPEASFLASVVGWEEDGLFFAGDIGQRIFQQPFSWKALGLDVRGRSFTLRVNYRTSQQIRSHADRLLPPAIKDVDGIMETRKDTVSLFEGPPPEVLRCVSENEESQKVCEWIKARLADGVAPDEISIFVRSEAQLPRGRSALKTAGLAFSELGEKIETSVGKIVLSTMHYAKGLEFKAVAVIACDEDVLPLQERIESIGDDSELEAVYETERHLLYVACTRARDYLLITGLIPVSEYLEDFGL